MNILYIDNQSFGKNDILAAFRRLGHQADLSELQFQNSRADEEFSAALAGVLEKEFYDIVFTSNFYPVVSNVCCRFNTVYMSWVYDSPQVLLYSKEIDNPCNYVFLFDSAECKRLQKLGIKTVFYMPLGANVERIDAITVSPKERELMSADVALVASLYNETHNLYDRMEPKLSDYAKGYTRALIQAQKNVMGGMLLEDAIKDHFVLKEMQDAMPYPIQEDSYAVPEYIYANYFLARKAASLQRLSMTAMISSYFDMAVYTQGDLSQCPKVRAMGMVDQETDQYKVFKCTKINLNISLPSIRSGIPLRVFDIMAAGGFLLTNYQADLIDAFEPGVDFVYYTSPYEAMDLIEYYLSHDEERRKIAQNGRKSVQKAHTYECRLKEMLEYCSKKCHA